MNNQINTTAGIKSIFFSWQVTWQSQEFSIVRESTNKTGYRGYDWKNDMENNWIMEKETRIRWRRQTVT